MVIITLLLAFIVYRLKKVLLEESFNNMLFGLRVFRCFKISKRDFFVKIIFEILKKIIFTINL